MTIRPSSELAVRCLDYLQSFFEVIDAAVVKRFCNKYSWAFHANAPIDAQ